MKILIYASYSFLNPHNGVLLDEAEKYIRDGHEVIFLICDKSIGRCMMNPLHDAGMCLSCKMQHEFLLRKLSKKVKRYYVSRFYDKQHVMPQYSYNSISDIKAINYRGIDIGYAVLSSYISLTRTLNPKFSESFKNFIKSCLSASIILSESFQKAVCEIKPDRICLFNGRLLETKPCLRIGQRNNIETFVYEVIGFTPNFRTVYFENTLPHDILYNTKLINDFWDNSKSNIEEKTKTAEKFYIKKRAGIPVTDVSYTSLQTLGQMPDKWDKTKMNIIIFNGSEDECVAVSSEYEEKLFSSQLDGMRHILSVNKDAEDIHFYIRIHPNLKNVGYKYHSDIYQFAEYKNCDIIPADSDISTYSLMENADKVIVFASTAGLEACYWRKPVILLAATYYCKLDAAYYPKNTDELQDLITDAELKPKDITGALKFGYFASEARGEKFQYFNYNLSEYGNTAKYQSVFGSNKLYFQIFRILRIPSRIIGKTKKIFGFRKETLPKDEE